MITTMTIMMRGLTIAMAIIMIIMMITTSKTRPNIVMKEIIIKVQSIV